MTSIGYGAFAYCSSLESIEIPDSVESIGEFAFADCSRLASIEISSSVTYIGSYAFRNCSALTIYAEVIEADKPSGWSGSWNPDNRPVEWGYTGE
ncbi:MAG: leucine-rich repeat domain-containing protein [Clostridiales bacterium]|nr:leucine-rich repeat domain-containing protein [Clostridiales bacterium]